MNAPEGIEADSVRITPRTKGVPAHDAGVHAPDSASWTRLARSPRNGVPRFARTKGVLAHHGDGHASYRASWTQNAKSSRELAGIHAHEGSSLASRTHRCDRKRFVHAFPVIARACLPSFRGQVPHLCEGGLHILAGADFTLLREQARKEGMGMGMGTGTGTGVMGKREKSQQDTPSAVGVSWND